MKNYHIPASTKALRVICQKQLYWLLLQKHHYLFHQRSYLTEQGLEIWNLTFFKANPSFSFYPLLPKYFEEWGFYLSKSQIRLKNIWFFKAFQDTYLKK